ncbi:OLC1v1001067C2 [Oldenlandia corymbosa var. corymbosa]|uniref:OLC1v1001067C2 n=1 Tax=Oldenlandia corymbosa var. corymbosa TaxID=529605 RepID=A0AAV1D787_OLDCO|nr:OLC1v1001067C2 [Oldenlandia corymbosa var. corymbosa]
MSVEQMNTDRNNVSGFCLSDLLRMEASSSCSTLTNDTDHASCGPQQRLENILSEPGNGFCADCGSPDPKWVSLSLGVFVCIKCSGVHRSMGVHITKVLSVKLDEWTNDQVDALVSMGGNTTRNLKYEACLPDNYRKPKPDSSNEERSDFIRRKYELHQFSSSDEALYCPLPSPSSSPCSQSQTSCSYISSTDHRHRRNCEKQTATSTNRFNGLGHAFRNSWRRTSEQKSTKKSNSMAGMVEFIGLIKVNVVRGTNLAVRDMMTSDPYVILSLGNQSVKTRVIKNNLNPVWNEKLMLSIPDNVPPLKLVTLIIILLFSTLLL